MSAWNALWVCLMTGVVFGTAVGENQKSFWDGYRAGFLATVLVTLGPAILFVLGHMRPDPAAVTGTVIVVNAVFWAWIFWALRSPRKT